MIPPFHPNRVKREWQYLRQPDESYTEDPKATPIHIKQTSSSNFRRRIDELRTPSLWLWFSGKTLKSDRASVMVYVIRERDDAEAWYVEYTCKNKNWTISKLVGVERQRLLRFANEGAARR